MARSFARGSSQYVDYTLSSNFSNGSAGPHTVACWAMSTDETVEQGIFGPTANNIAGPTLLIEFRGDIGDDRILGYCWGASALATPNSGGVVDYAANTWYHVAIVTASTNSRQLYVNGTSMGTDTTTTGNTDCSHIVQGCFSLSSRSSYMSGQLMHCAAWEAALDAAEIASLYKGFSPRRVRPQSLKHYDPCIRAVQSIFGNAPSSVTDSSGGAVAHQRSYGY